MSHYGTYTTEIRKGDVVNRHRRSRKEQGIDKKNGHNDMVQNVDMKVLEKFKAKAYSHTDVIGFLKAKGHNVKGEMSSGGS